MSVVIAIDPGVSGGVAVSAFGKTFCHPMPDTEGDRLELIRDLHRTAAVEGVECVCVLEQVGGFVGKGQPGSAMFKFGEHFGFFKGVVQALGIKLVLVRPQVWQKAFGLGTASHCTSKSEWKNKLKAEAQRRFPTLGVTLKTADALLILDYALREGFNRSERKDAEVLTANDAKHANGIGAHGGPSRTGNKRPTKTISAGDVCLQPGANNKTETTK